MLRILFAIGPTETSHCQTWHNKAGNEVNDPLAPLNVVIAGQPLRFPNLNLSGGEDTQTNLIMPVPTIFLRGFPPCRSSGPPRPRGRRWGRSRR